MDFSASIFSDLKDKDFSAQGLMVLEGRITIEKALEKGIKLVGLASIPERAEEWRTKLGSETPLIAVPQAELSRIIGFPFHRGSLALAIRPEIAEFSAISACQAANAQKPWFVCLWDIADPSNVGAIIRSAAALNAGGIILGPGTADPLYRKAIRASMGNVFALPLFSLHEKTLEDLGSAGVYRIAGALSAKAVSLPEACQLSRGRLPAILLVGNEGYGLPEKVLSACDLEVFIPMAGGVDSLNVAAASAILMYELFA